MQAAVGCRKQQGRRRHRKFRPGVAPRAAAAAEQQLLAAWTCHPPAAAATCQSRSSTRPSPRPRGHHPLPIGRRRCGERGSQLAGRHISRGVLPVTGRCQMCLMGHNRYCDVLSCPPAALAGRPRSPTATDSSPRAPPPPASTSPSWTGRPQLRKRQSGRGWGRLLGRRWRGEAGLGR